jgi:shikimate kinase
MAHGRGKGTAFGAATIVNAMPSGFGAALSVGLRTFAEVELTGERDVKVEIAGDSSENTRLAAESFRIVLDRFGVEGGGKVKTRSEIPIACGMKSSSAASNAVVMATLQAVDGKLDDLSIINLGVEASLRAKATVTGAFDDACASLLGRLHLTDNSRRRIIKSYDVEPLSALFLVPQGKSYSGDVKISSVKSSSKLSGIAFSEALQGRYWQAMLLNGFAMSRIFGYDPLPIIQAMQGGAISAGLSGKGPAVCAVCKKEDEPSVVESWKPFGHKIIGTEVNLRRAMEAPG